MFVERQEWRLEIEFFVSDYGTRETSSCKEPALAHSVTISVFSKTTQLN